MDKQEIIRTAVQLEVDGRAFYLDAAGKVTSPAVKQVLESLAKDEESHIRWIEENLGIPESAGQLNRESYDRVKHIFAAVPKDQRERFVTSPDDIAPLRQAIDREVKTANAYTKWADEVDDPTLKGILQKLAEVERFHEKLLENTILYLENPDQYFQQEEGWMFDGG
jgi:rubrerythrin